MVVHKIYQHLTLQDPTKFTQITTFGLKIYHLAALHSTPYIVENFEANFQRKQLQLYPLMAVQAVAAFTFTAGSIWSWAYPRTLLNRLSYIKFCQALECRPLVPPFRYSN
jgi:hypothetical protein